MKIIEEPFLDLSRSLNGVARDLDRTVREALDYAADDGREMIREEMRATQAPKELAGALRTFHEDRHTRAVGISERSPHHQAALDYEFGTADRSPTATFRMMGPQLAEWAADDIAGAVEQAVTGG